MLPTLRSSLPSLGTGAAARHVLPATIVTASLFVLLQRAFITTFYDPTQCMSMAQDGGFWLDPSPTRNATGYYNRFQPHSCIPYNYTWSDLTACIPEGKIIYVGDSTVCYPYVEFINLYWDHRNYFIDRLGPLALTHQHIAFDLGPIDARYLWEVFLNGDIQEAWKTRIADEIPARWNSSGQHEMAAMQGSSLSKMDAAPAFLFGGTGLWELRANEGDVKRTIDAIDVQLSPWLDRLDILDEDTDLEHDPYLKPRAPGFFYLNPLQVPDPEFIPKTGEYDWLSVDRVKQVNKWLRQRTKNNLAGALGMFTFNSMTPYKAAMLSHDGQHAYPEVNREKNNLMLNHRCNKILADMGKIPAPSNGICCLQPPVGPLLQWFLLFVSIIAAMTLVWGTARFYTGKDTNRPQEETVGSARKLSESISPLGKIRDFCNSSPLLSQSLPFILAMCCSILADRTFLLSTQQKYFSFRMNLLYNALTLFIGLFSQQKVENSISHESFPRSISTAIHTNEWKGWLTLLACGIEYFAPPESASLQATYNYMGGAFIFLFAFGNTIYLQDTPRPRPLLHRVVRLNALSLCLGIFIPGISSSAAIAYTFLLTTCFGLLALLLYSRRNREDSFVNDLTAPIVSLVVVLCVQHFTPVLNFVAAPIERSVALTFPSFDMVQTLTVCAALLHLGYIAALSVPRPTQLSTTSGELHSISWKPDRMLSGYRILALGFFITFSVSVIMVLEPHLDLRREWIPGFAHNFTPSHLNTTILTSLIPTAVVLVSPFFRAVKPMGDYYSPLLAWIGNQSLEIYLLRQHLWLGADGSALTRLALFDSYLPAGGFGRRLVFVLRGLDMFILGALVLFLSHFVRDADLTGCTNFSARGLDWLLDKPIAGNKTLGGMFSLNFQRPTKTEYVEEHNLLGNGPRS